MTPAFHFKILHGFIDTFYENSLILTNKLALHHGRETFNTHEYNVLYALDNICGTYNFFSSIKMFWNEDKLNNYLDPRYDNRKIIKTI